MLKQRELNSTPLDVAIWKPTYGSLIASKSKALTQLEAQSSVSTLTRSPSKGTKPMNVDPFRNEHLTK